MGYLTSKFQSAVAILCGRGPVKQRLATAFTTHLRDLHDDEMAPNQREAFANLRKRLQRVAPMNGEGRVRASVRKMSPDEAAECAETIVELYVGLLQESPGATPLHLVESDAEPLPEVPRFLTKS